jgi:imidazolonepropionase-like amidohydrolase
MPLHRALIAACCLLPAGLPPNHAPQRSTVAFTDVSVLPMDRPGVLPHQTVIAGDGRIPPMGPAATTAVPAGARVIDGRGKTLMPGLIDAHVHMRTADVPAYLASGILTVRNMWGHDGIIRLQADIAAGRLDGPTIHSLSPGLDASPGFWPFTQFVDDAARADSVVGAQQSAGWTTIKVYQRLSAAAFDSIVASVHRRQLRFAGHVPTAVTIQHALASGMESIEHYTGYDRAVSRSGSSGTFGWADADTSRLAALADATVRSGTWNCPTMAINTMLAAQQDPEAQRRVVQNRQLFTRLLHERGAPLVAGTDAGIGRTAPGTSLLDELREFVASGFTNWEALRLATVEPGRLLHVPQLGTVTVGAPAELLLLDGNPADDLAALKTPAGILLHGEWLDGATLAASARPPAPRPP